MSERPDGDRLARVGRDVPRRLCDEWVPGSHKAFEWGGTYCKLLAGHDGPHSSHYPKERCS